MEDTTAASARTAAANPLTTTRKRSGSCHCHQLSLTRTAIERRIADRRLAGMWMKGRGRRVGAGLRDGCLMCRPFIQLRLPLLVACRPGDRPSSSALPILQASTIDTSLSRILAVWLAFRAPRSTRLRRAAFHLRGSTTRRAWPCPVDRLASAPVRLFRITPTSSCRN